MTIGSVQSKEPKAFQNSSRRSSTGRISHDWPIVRLDEVATIQTGISKSQNRTGPSVVRPYLRVANVQDGHLDLSEVKEIQVPVHMVDRYSLRYGDVLLTEGGDFDKLGRGYIWHDQISNCVHQNHVFVVRPNSELLIPEFLAGLTQSFWGRRYFLSCSKQSTNLASINSSQLKAFPTPLPSLSEQRRIATILGEWERGIQKHQTLIRAQVRRRSTLIHRLLTGGARLPGFLNRWQNVRLGTVARNVNERSHGFDSSRLYGVTKAEGIVPMREHVKGADFSRCKLLKPGWFAYNPMRLNIGSIARWTGEEDVMVSGDYVVFRCGKDLDSRFFDFVRRSNRWKYFVNTQGNGSVRVRLYFKDIARFQFSCPPLDEQRAIADVLSACDREIELCRHYLEALRKQKQGLMEKLLTGKVRVQHGQD